MDAFSYTLSIINQNALSFIMKRISFGLRKKAVNEMVRQKLLEQLYLRFSLFLNLLILVVLISSYTHLYGQEAENIFYGKYFHGFNQTYPVPEAKYIFSQQKYFPLEAGTAAGINSPEVDFNLFGNFGNNIINSFKGNNLYFQLAGIALTSVLVTQDIDYKVEHFFNQHPDYGTWARPILTTGELLPFIVGGGLYAYGKLDRNNEFVGASFAVLQASLIEFLYNSTLKAITGRPGPDWRHNQDMESLSKTFRFGFLRGGIFWGWPSGHTSSTMAVVSALTNYFPNSTWLKIVGYTWVAYTIFGVSSVNRGGMHWFSDAVAAALMAYAVGSTVGKYYRSVYDNASSVNRNSKQVSIMPEANPIGINLSFQF